MTLRALGVPRAARVTTGADGAPCAVDLPGGRRRGVTAVRDDWLVQDLWWTDRPVDRHFFELVLDSGRLVVAYREALDGTWFAYC